MPCKTIMARLLLKAAKAKCVKCTPFTIKPLMGAAEYTQEVIAGMDAGSKTIGSATIANAKVIDPSEIKVRQDVSKKRVPRSMYLSNRERAIVLEQHIPTDKLFGLRKLDSIQTPKGIG